MSGPRTDDTEDHSHSYATESLLTPECRDAKTQEHISNDGDLDGFA